MDNLLFKDESILSRSADDTIILTTNRIRQRLEGGKIVNSVMLDNIDAVRSEFESRPWLIGLGIASFLAAAIFYAGNESSFSVIGVIAGITFIIMYFSSRRHVITIRSSSTSIVFQTNDMSEEQVLEFLNRVEEARKDVLEGKHNFR